MKIATEAGMSLNTNKHSDVSKVINIINVEINN